VNLLRDGTNALIASDIAFGSEESGRFSGSTQHMKAFIASYDIVSSDTQRLASPSQISCARRGYFNTISSSHAHLRK